MKIVCKIILAVLLTINIVKAQDTLYIYKSGSVITKRAVAEIDSIIFYQASSASFTCGTSTINDVDGNTYNTVLIGTQCWLAKNLNIGTKINSNSGSDNQTNNGVIEKYCYNNDANNCNVYGGLYQWDEMMQYNPSDNGTTGITQGICPTGWHVPTDAEYTTLTSYLGGESIAGGKLKESGTTHWISSNTGATNESGFTALPGGYRYSYDGSFSTLGYSGYFWSATESDAASAWNYRLNYNGAHVGRYGDYKTDGFSVRCLKD